jgi:hypothetical protein
MLDKIILHLIQNICGQTISAPVNGDCDTCSQNWHVILSVKRDFFGKFFVISVRVQRHWIFDEASSRKQP